MCSSDLANHDLVIDASDNFATRFLVCDAAHARGIPVVFAAVDRFEGQVALFDSRSGSCYRCLYPSPPKARIQNCAESGVLGSVVGVLGTLQAQLALQLLISGGDRSHPLFPPAGRMTLVDLAGPWSFSSLQVPKRSNCPTCSKDPAEITLSDGADRESCSVRVAGSISVREICDRSATGGFRPVLLDVRTRDEWNEGHLPESLHWPLDRLESGEWPAGVARESELVVDRKSTRLNSSH